MKTIRLVLNSSHFALMQPDDPYYGPYRAAVEKYLRRAYPDAEVTVTAKPLGSGAPDVVEFDGFGGPEEDKRTVLTVRWIA